MKKLLILAALSFMSFQTAQAAFYPLDQSIIEIRDIISSPELKRFIPPLETILDIRRVQGGYLITTNHYQLMVEVRYRGLLKQGEQQTEANKYTLNFKEPQQVSK